MESSQASVRSFTVKKILDDIYSFPLKLPFPATPELSVYYLDGDKPAIIDTGLGDQQSMADISSALNQKGKDLKDISLIINSHEHIEHFGGNRKIKDASNAAVAASSSAALMIENFQDATKQIRNNISGTKVRMFETLKMFINFHLTIDPSSVDTRVRDGDVIDLGAVKLRVISTPGHAEGHVCLYDAERKILFSGDHIISTGSTFVGYGWREMATGRILDIFSVENNRLPNISQYIESVKKIQALDLDLILPAHGPPITDPYQKLEDEIENKKNRVRACADILQAQGEMALEDLAAAVYEEEQSNYLQQGAVLGYLEVLSRSGKIDAVLKDEDLYARIKAPGPGETP